MVRDLGKVLLAGLAGAGLVALIDGLLQLAFPGRGYVRELATLAVAGAWLITGGIVIALGFIAKLTRRPLPRPGTAFFLGWAVALAPIAWNILSSAGERRPALPLVALAPLAMAAAAPLLGRWFAPGRLAWPVVGAGLVLLALAPLLPPSGYEGREAPPYLERDGSPAASGPDVVLISIDTLRADVVVGPQRAEVANLDALRASGFYAEYALSTSNQTLPGHVAMLTGLDAMAHGVRSNVDLPRRELELVSQRFQAAGYATAGVISNGLLSRHLDLGRGYDVYDDSLVAWSMASRAFGDITARNTWLGWLLSERRYASLMRLTFMRALLQGRKGGGGTGEPVTARAIARIGELAARPRPYFLFAHLMDVHMPYPRLEGFRGRYTKDLPRPGPEYLPADDRSIPQAYLRRAEADLQAGKPEALAARDYYLAAYKEVVCYIDHCVGRIVDAIEATGRPTVVLFTADHGEHFGEQRLFEHANSLYEPLLRVPFLVGFVNWKGAPPARGALAVPVTLSDAAPTLLDLAGLAYAGMTGVPAHRIGAPPTMLATDDRRVSVRAGRWKWIGTWSKDGPPKDLALYDLEQDPGEERNLLAAGAAVPEEVRALLARELERDTYSQNLADASPEQRAVLNELGYADDHEEEQEDEEEERTRPQ